MELLKHVFKKYNDRPLYDLRKAQYSIGFVLLLVVITILLTTIKALVVGVSNFDLIVSSANVFTFIIIYYLIYKGHIYIGVWILSLAGIIRVYQIFFTGLRTEFYLLVPLILISNSFIHYKKEQYYFINGSLLLISIYNVYDQIIYYSVNSVDYEVIGISLSSLFYLLAMIYIISIFTKNTDKEIEMTLELKDMAVKDQLTEVYNRRKLDSTSKDEFINTTNSILVIDFDYFKKVNDKFGHIKGDIVLRETVSVITKMIRKDDFIVRFGGEEFIVLLKECDYASGVRIAESIREKISNHNFECVDNYHITISIGGTVMNNEEGIYEAIDRADKAMYRAKDRGRNQVVFR